jgi:uncharacterized repeat protein (TIGR03837 family)
MRWDLFCSVIDNFGDIGVCWRLAADLGTRGESVRLWVDDPAALAWMAPHGAPGVDVMRWTELRPDVVPGDVVIEAFGIDPPAAFVRRMALADKPPVWINLEYLSAEDYVERSHGLPSPQTSGPGAGLTKWFFYPGFTARTGGLLREPPLPQARTAFDREAWLAGQGLTRRGGERIASLFCYGAADLHGLLDSLAEQPTLLLLCPGPARERLQAMDLPAAIRLHALPWLSQAEYDHLLWSADINFVRGEDSFVRAQWAGAPFVWHIYPQHDGAHAAKLDAFLDRFSASAPASVHEPLRTLWHAWNGLGQWPERLPAEADWRAACERWRDGLLVQADLTSQLRQFVSQKR